MRDDPPLTPELLLQAYRIGVFPMSESRDNPDVFWVDPRRRGVLPLDGFHTSRSLRRTLNSGRFTASLNTDFAGVLDGCAGRSETWINRTIADLYLALHDMGNAHAVEIRAGDQLVGGVYGVAIGGAFFGESMFSTQTDASKAALAVLTTYLRQRGFTLFDAQFITPHLSSLGALEVPRSTYHQMLESALTLPASIGPAGPLPLP